ncbi:hypothetical protein [Kosakonia cowanii]|uniref:hypothetical protein n=1 Tax=Kosakonia cowanii TaxID=208223 RepID=UPI00289687C4|nr:hypothetical protein [Kosakonia cowanii]
MYFMINIKLKTVAYSEVKTTLFIRSLLVFTTICISTPLYADENLIKLKALNDFADQLKENIGQDVNTVEPIVGHPLFRLNPANEYWLTTKAFTLNGGVTLSNLAVRLDHKHPPKVFIIHYDVSDVCILLSDVRKIYPQLKLFSAPHGHSVNETFAWITPLDKNGNATAFAFPYAEPACLKGMTVRNFADDV